MKTTNYFVSIVVLLVIATFASAAAIPPGSILLGTRSNAAGIVALDLDGNVVGGFVPNTPYDVVDVQQIAVGGDILLGHQPAGGDVVSRYDVNGNFLGNVVGTIANKYAAHLAIADPLDGSNTAYCEHNKGGLGKIDLSTNQIITNWTSAEDMGARGIDVGPDGYVYMAAQYEGIWKFSADLSSYTVAVADPQASFGDITFGPDGMLYASTYANNGVRRYDVSTGAATDFIASAGSPIDLCTGLMFHPTTGNLLVSSYRNNKILEFNGDTGAYMGVFVDVAQPWCISMAPVPEPSIPAMLLLGAISFVAIRRRG